MQAVILARVSSKDQEDGFSIDAQLERLNQYCIRRNLQIARVFSFTESSSSGDRKKFQEVLNYIKLVNKETGSTVSLVADKVDRLIRNFNDYPVLNSLYENNIAELCFVGDNLTIGKNSTSQDKMIWQFRIMMAQSYIEAMKENVKRSIDFKKEKGEWPHMAPIGYLNSKDAEGKSVVIPDPDKAPIIREIFQRYSTGLYSTDKLVHIAKRAGLTGTRGNLSKSRVGYIINNPFYYGIMKIKGTYRPHIHEPIITKDLFDKCQDVLKGKHKPVSAGKEFIFKGLITCERSGRLAGCDTKKGHNYIIAYDENRTSRIYVKESTIMEEVNEILNDIVLPDFAEKELIENLRQAKEHEVSIRKESIDRLNRERSSLKARQDQLLDLYIDKKIGKEQYDGKYNQFKIREFEIAEEIKMHSLGDEQFNNALIRHCELANRAYKLLPAMSTEEKRKMLKFLFANLSLNGRNLAASLRSPYDRFYKTTTRSEWRGLWVDLRTVPELRNSIFPIQFNELNLNPQPMVII